mmetsp:Transcript_48297/g.56457  ORF Transcript_48297/g.56457 Transcript_48297/m.56457 type:complete len:378 (-) Transcript_48297:224-1357(-)
MSASEDEIEMYRELFTSFDIDGNGKIDANELDIGLRNAGMSRRRESVIKMIDDVDTDNDHELDFDEFLNLIQSEQLAKLFEDEKTHELKRQSVCVGLQNIYGQTPTPPETEESVKAGLERLQVELDGIKGENKKGFNQALEKCPHLIDDDFLLMFLRTEVFHAGRAAQRLVTYWDKRIEIFGEAKAFMRLTLDEALADDSVALSLGYVRPTGQSDSTGRAILFMDFSQEGKADCTSFSLIRTVWYAIHVALEDENAQKEGMVIVVKCCDSLRQWSVKTSKEMAGNMQGALPFRLGCFQICHPPSFINIVLNIVRLLTPKKLRNRIKKHKGTHEEVLESLAIYGIPKSAVPDIWGGDLNLEGHSEWLEARRSIENGRY